MDQESALALLRKSLNNEHAAFRENQWEAIDTVVNQRKKLLVIERTGWGKSSVYFLSTRILRDQGKGITIIISPLLALMRNQIEAAMRLGIRAVSINSTNIDDWEVTKNKILNDQVDALLISPERLANDSFMESVLRPIADRIALFVVDEAHCISDWGHDFRTDYRRIVGIIKMMPAGMPVLGTTATANNRVVEDVLHQLGELTILRGPLVRESIVLENINLPDQSARLAWLKENIPRCPGSGIIYTLTVSDAIQVTRWLKLNGINAEAYYSGVKNTSYADSNRYREFLEDQLYTNKLKVLVSTSALGMGYDKPDLGFVIHYQAPGSIISYYQQVGRAGRAITEAYGVMLSGSEDEDIHAYFRHAAFPTEDRVALILDTLAEGDGLSVPNLAEKLNLRYGQIEQVLKYLSVEEPSPIVKMGTKWLRTAVAYSLDTEKILRLTNQKLVEWQEVQGYTEFEGCLMTYLQKSLDDPILTNCGKCYNCTRQSIFTKEASHSDSVEASLFLKKSEIDILPRLQLVAGGLPGYGWKFKLPAAWVASPGKALSRRGDSGWGRTVEKDKKLNHFSDELVNAVYSMLTERWKHEPRPKWVTCVPSLRNTELVPEFAERLAQKLGIPFLAVVSKIKEVSPQAEQENSVFQCRNLDNVFKISAAVMHSSVYLIDDAIDSGWTLTVIAALLLKAGSGPVFPIALTSSSLN